MKHPISKIILVAMVMFALLFSLGKANASEITGTLSTAPNANAQTSKTSVNTKANTSTDYSTPINTPPTDTSTNSGVTGVTGSTTAPSTGGANLWLWIGIPALVIIAALVYFFRRPSMI